MERDAGDIIDRWAIAKLKAERVGADESKNEYFWFCEGIKKLENKYPQLTWNTYKQEILTIHAKIWDLESAVRQGKLDNDLMEVGRRAIQIRDWNKKRITLKNTINVTTGEGFQDIKKDHGSE
jgi:PIN domain nuclease of toxin-antitoxin system